MIQVGLRPAGPMDVVKDEPAARRQLLHFLLDQGLTGRPHGPSTRIPFSLLQLSPQTPDAVRSEPRLLGGPVSCSHVVPQRRWPARLHHVGAVGCLPPYSSPQSHSRLRHSTWADGITSSAGTRGGVAPKAQESGRRPGDPATVPGSRRPSGPRSSKASTPATRKRPGLPPWHSVPTLPT
jgi:hypothetical protein